MVSWTMAERAALVIVRTNDLRDWTRAARSEHDSHMATFVVGTDGSPNAELALRRAASIAKADGAALHVVAAYPDVATFSVATRCSAKCEPYSLCGHVVPVLDP